jgi:sialidase-1
MMPPPLVAVLTEVRHDLSSDESVSADNEDFHSRLPLRPLRPNERSSAVWPDEHPMIMYYALSGDSGKTWGPVQSFGFPGHCPYFLRHSSGVILLAHRMPATSLHWTADEGKTWHGPVRIDAVARAYPSSVELSDGQVYCVYYEEGKGSSIRGVRIRLDITKA